MRKHVVFGTLLALGIGGHAVAAESFSYNNMEAAYVSTEIDSEGVDGDGLSIGGSLEINANTFGFASLNDIDYDAGIGTSAFTLGLGFHWPLNAQLDLVSGLSYERIKFKISGVGSATESGLGLNVGLRGRVAESLEVTAGAKYMDLGNGVDDITWTAGGRYYFTPNFAAGIDFGDNDDGSTWTIALRYDFGNVH